jgi:hypothetical protein
MEQGIMGIRAKLKTKSPRMINSWLMFVTVAFIVVATFIYWFIYVRNSENAQVAKRFKVLARMGQNIYNREKGLKSIAKNALEKSKIKVRQKYDQDPDLAFPILKDIVEDEIRDARLITMKSKKSLSEDNILTLLTLKDKLQPDDPGYVIYIGKDQFFAPLLRSDVFDYLIVCEEKKSKDQSGKTSSTAAIVYSTFPGDLNIPDLTKLRNPQGPIEAGSLSTIVLSNKKYQLFIQPLKLEDGRKWYIGCVIDMKTFNRQVRALDPSIVVYLLIGFLIFIFGIPLLKLFLMSSFDQLSIKDVVLTTFAVVFCALMLLLLNLAIYQDYHDDDQVDRNLETLSTVIEKRFCAELGDIYSQLRGFDNSYSNDKELLVGDIFYNIFSDTVMENEYAAGEELDPSASQEMKKKKIENMQQKLSKLNEGYNLYKILFWMDGTGEQVLQFSTRNYSGGMDNLGHRAYFKEAGKWNLDESPVQEAGRPFMLESITSITSGEKMAAVSTPVSAVFNNAEGEPTHAEVIAMTSQLTSVIDTLMPVGYGFCIIDRTGKAWFHSDTERNLQENFIHETGNDSELLTAISLKQPGFFSLAYQRKSHHCRFRLLSHYPLFLITFYDKTSTQSVQAAVIIRTVALILGLLLFVCLLFSTSIVLDYRKSLLKYRYLPFDWLRPQTTESSKAYYKHLQDSTSIILLLTIIFTIYARTLEVFFLCLSAQLFAISYNYYFLSMITRRHLRPKLYKVILFLLGFLFLIHLGSALALGLGKQGFLLLFEALLAAALLLLYLFRSKLRRTSGSGQGRDPANKDTRNSTIRNYLVFMFLWLVLICAIPLNIFFNNAFDFERTTRNKQNQLQFEQAREERESRIDRFYKERMDPEKGNPVIMSTKQKRIKQGIYAEIVGEKIFPEQPDVPGAKEEDRLYGVVTRLYQFKDILKGMPLLVFLGVSLVIFVIVFLIIRFVVCNIFGLHLVEDSPGDQLSTGGKEAGSPVLREIHQFLRSGSHVAVQCQTGEQMEYFTQLPQETLLPASGSLEDIDFKDLLSHLEKPTPEPQPTGRQVLRILHLDVHLSAVEGDRNYEDDIKTLESMLNTLQNPHSQVIAPINTPLAELIEIYHDADLVIEAEAKETASKKKELPETEKEKHERIRRISVLLKEIESYFSTVYVPLSSPDDAKQTYKKIYPIKHPEIKQLILDEFKPSSYFSAIEADIYDYYTRLTRKKSRDDISPEELDVIKEKIILRIQELSQHYYLRLLKSCSRKEKFVLYDISQDGLINFNNKETIAMLLKRGLLRYDGTIEVMNKSFRNYVLCAIDTAEAEHLIGGLSAKGRWKSYQAPIYLLILGAAAFLAFQEDLMSDLNAILATLVGGAGILTRFSGLLSKLPLGKG